MMVACQSSNELFIANIIFRNVWYLPIASSSFTRHDFQYCYQILKNDNPNAFKINVNHVLNSTFIYLSPSGIIIQRHNHT